MKYEYLGDFICSENRTPDGLVDMRGFDFSCGQKQRSRFYGDHILRVDFRNSRAETGFVIRNTLFEWCVFDDSVWWLAGFHNCKFINCSFNGCQLYSSGLNGKFNDCSFINLYAKGEWFYFGQGSIYENCVFESVKILSLHDVIGVRFKDCQFSGIFEASKAISRTFFRGRKYALKERFSRVPKIFSNVYRPVKLIRCDLSGLKLKNVVFEKDVIIKDTLMPIVENE